MAKTQKLFRLKKRKAYKELPTLPELPAASRGDRFDLFRRVFELRRRIAMANPLLAQVPQLLFVKNALACPSHICDQFFGPLVQGSNKGGLFVLADPFSPQPRIRALRIVQLFPKTTPNIGQPESLNFGACAPITSPR